MYQSNMWTLVADISSPNATVTFQAQEVQITRTDLAQLKLCEVELYGGMYSVIKRNMYTVF